MTKNSGNLEKRLAAYGSMSLALAAVAMPAARADVITHTTGNITTSSGAAGAVYFDLLTGAYGKNGVNGFTATWMDFELLTSVSSSGGAAHPPKANLLIAPASHLLANGNQFAASASLVFGGGASSIAKLSPGARIGPNLVFSNAHGTLAESSAPQFGHWNQRPAWADVGLAVNNPSTGNVNYGWANIQVNGNYTITLLQFGVDNSGASVTAGAVPEPSSIVLLTLGAAGIAVWRRKKGSRSV